MGICCSVVGTVLGAMKASGREHLTVSLLMIGKYLVDYIEGLKTVDKKKSVNQFLLLNLNGHLHYVVRTSIFWSTQLFIA